MTDTPPAGPPPPPASSPPTPDPVADRTLVGFFRLMWGRLAGRQGMAFLGFLILLIILGVFVVLARDDSPPESAPDAAVEVEAGDPAVSDDGQEVGEDETPAPAGESPDQPGESPEESGVLPEESGGSSEEPAAEDGDSPNPFAEVTGTYRLVEASAHEAMGPVVADFYSAEGLIEVDADGTVSGVLVYQYAETMGSEPNLFMVDVFFDATLVEAALEEGDSGFRFTTTLEVVLDVTPRKAANPEAGIPPPFTRDHSFAVSGVVDPESGSIDLSQVGEEGGPGVVVFRR